MYTLQGKAVHPLSLQSGEQVLSLSSLPPQVYLLAFYQEGQYQGSAKLMKE